MAKQQLGERKKRKVDRILSDLFNEDIETLVCYTRGGWGHFNAEAWTDKSFCFMVNYKTGEVYFPIKGYDMYGDHEKWLDKISIICGYSDGLLKRINGEVVMVNDLIQQEMERIDKEVIGDIKEEDVELIDEVIKNLKES